MGLVDKSFNKTESYKRNSLKFDYANEDCFLKRPLIESL